MVEGVRQSPVEPEKSSGPKLIIIRGIPGSGKSFLAQELVRNGGLGEVATFDPDEVPSDHPDFVRFSSNLSAGEPSLDLRFHPYRFLLAGAKKGLQEGKTVIWDQPFRDLPSLKKTIGKLEQYVLTSSGMALVTLIVEVKTPPELARERLEARRSSGGHGPDLNDFAKYVDGFSSAVGLGYPTMEVDGQMEVEEMAQRILERLKQVGNEGR